MKLHIENFAKIANADIEINGITVIAGENNTGKSTVGKVLYSIYSAFHDIDFKVKEERKKSGRDSRKCVPADRRKKICDRSCHSRNQRRTYL